MRILKILPLVILLAACSTPVVSPTPAPSVYHQGPLTLTIYSPQDQATVSSSKVDIKGTVSEAAVLTINDDIYVLEPGEFTQPVSLSEGLNAVQIVASDMDGNEIDLILTLTYQP